MASKRLDLALRELTSGDWQTFERFAAHFLVTEFPALRTTASASGDRGRDGELFQIDGAPTTVFQYSVADDWASKIKATAKRLADTMPQVTRIIYCTNQQIGPAADTLVEDFRANGIALDVRDRSWFTDRERTNAQREIASEDLCRQMVDPLLSREGINSSGGPHVSGDDARVALLHLTLEGYDQTTDKNLTKSCFEALVLAALHGTSSDNPATSEEVEAAVRALVTAENTGQVDLQTSHALARLSAKRGPVKYVSKTGVYHLSYEEQLRNEASTTDFLSDQHLLEDELIRAIDSLGLEIDPAACQRLAVSLRMGVEEVLLRRGELFARAVAEGVMSQIDVDEVMNHLTEQGTQVDPLSRETAARVIFAVMEDPSPQTRKHLGRLADAYTLFAFLRQTADVQKAVLTVFSGGDIWLDSTIILPLLAETLIEDPSERHFTVLLSAAVDAGFNLYVTDGIVEEVTSHLSNSLLCARTTGSDWESSVPFVFAAYTLTGRSRGDFVTWVAEFRGDSSPTDDLKDYLREVFHIGSRNLIDQAVLAPAEVRAAVQEVWSEAHDTRRARRQGRETAPEISSRLVAHDVECSVGVMQLRQATTQSSTGYMHWWLTLDHVGFELTKRMQPHLKYDPPPSPALSPDFLSQLLRLGPLRRAIEQGKHVALPVVSAISKYDSIPVALIELADSTRRLYEGQSERVVRRHVRDRLNEMRWHLGQEAQAGVAGAERRVSSQITKGPRSSA